MYSKMIVRSVGHIFRNFLEDQTIEEVYETQARNGRKISIEISGGIKGGLIITMPASTLNMIAKKIIDRSKSMSAVKHYQDVAGEIANLIAGGFANQMQFRNHMLLLSAPEFDNDPIAIKALYENVNLSFASEFGGFDIDLYYKEPV